MLKITDTETFTAGESALGHWMNVPTRIKNGIIMLCLSGSSRITVNFESEFIGKNMQAIVLPQNVIKLSNPTPDFNVLYFSFSASMMDEACFRIDSELFGFLKENFLYEFTPDRFQVQVNLLGLVQTIFQDKENRFRYKIGVNYLQNFFLNTFDKIYSDHTNRDVKNLGRKNELFKKFVRLVHRHYKSIREVNFYANELNISPRYLSRITQDVDNITAKAFIDNCVIEEIKLLLNSSELSVQQIADYLNFPDQSYMGRFFKNKTGISPSSYRNK